MFTAIESGDCKIYLIYSIKEDKELIGSLSWFLMQSPGMIFFFLTIEIKEKILFY